jgi:hypothetical protein
MLPRLLPMLAVPAAPFDSPEYSFECKWDGIRALAAVETTGWQMWGRQQADYTTRYPEFDVLCRLPVGTLVDGELVALDVDGRPDLPRLMRRHGLADPWRIRQARHWCPVCFVLFDVLFYAGRCLLQEPLVRFSCKVFLPHEAGNWRAAMLSGAFGVDARSVVGARAVHARPVGAIGLGSDFRPTPLVTTAAVGRGGSRWDG